MSSLVGVFGEDIVNRVLEIDRLISRLQGVVDSRIDEEILEKSRKGIYDKYTLNNILEKFRYIKDKLETRGPGLTTVNPFWAHVSVNILPELIRDVSALYRDYCRPLDGEVKCYKISTTRIFTEDFEKIWENIGRKCGYMSTQGTDVSLLQYMNDVADCIHQFGEELIKAGASEKHGKCFFGKDASEDLKNLCLEWNDIIDKYSKVYAIEDWSPLVGFITDNIGSFRVGSAGLHATKIDLNKNTLQYFDADSDVTRIIMGLIEKAGGRCEEETDGAICNITSETVDKLAPILASATSLDLKLMGIEDQITSFHPEISPLEDEIYEAMPKAVLDACGDYVLEKKIPIHICITDRFTDVSKSLVKEVKRLWISRPDNMRDVQQFLEHLDKSIDELKSLIDKVENPNLMSIELFDKIREAIYNPYFISEELEYGIRKMPSKIIGILFDDLFNLATDVRDFPVKARDSEVELGKIKITPVHYRHTIRDIEKNIGACTRYMDSNVEIDFKQFLEDYTSCLETFRNKLKEEIESWKQ